MLLLMDLLERRADGDPVPVLLTLTGWDPDRTDFPSWLGGRLAEDYPALRASDYGADAATALVRQRHILPFLDGLDEIQAELRIKVIGALNRSMSYDDQLVLITRSAEYTATGVEVCAGTVIEPDPLTSASVIGYITACLPREQDPAWHSVLKVIRDDRRGPLAASLATPLNLWLLRQVYIATAADPAPLADRTCFPTAQAISSHLLGSLVNALTSAQPPARAGQPDAPLKPRHRWSPDEASRWHRCLASQMNALGTHDLAWWYLSAAVPRWQVKLAGTVIIGPPLALVLGPGFHDLTYALLRMVSARGTTFSLGLQLAAGSVAAIPYLFLVGRPLKPGPAESLSRKRAVPQRNIRRGFAFGVAIGAAAWASLALENASNTESLSTGIAAAFAAGLAIGVTPEPGPAPSYASFSLHGRVQVMARQMLQGSASGLTVGLLLWGTVTIITPLFHLPTSDARYIFAYTCVLGLVGGVTLGTTSGLINWATIPAGSARPATPASTLRDERLICVLRGLSYGLTSWLVLSAAFALHLSVELALIIGLLGGLPAGLAAVLSSAWPGYLIARLLLASRRQLPLRLSTFLDDAHRMGILRRSGAVYQFRHATLQDHLAANEHGATPAIAPSPALTRHHAGQTILRPTSGLRGQPQRCFARRSTTLCGRAYRDPFEVGEGWPAVGTALVDEPTVIRWHPPRERDPRGRP
jgi:hypothetical protein